MNVPTAYAEGYRTARPTDPEAVDNYIKHTCIGDPELDPIMEELSSMPPGELHRFIGAGIEGRDDVLKTAPEPLRNFFKNLEEPPWLDYEALRPGIRAFHGNVDLRAHSFRAYPDKEFAQQVRGMGPRRLGYAGKHGAPWLRDFRLFSAPG
ncbi:hypothetical protein [Candidatus Palauibacter sp.]|uniref:hypothetical protein n=1 Tax=Candidatus Palauibacter sp. TaxID=3101350 RepID=UPI003B01CC23